MVQTARVTLLDPQASQGNTKLKGNKLAQTMQVGSIYPLPDDRGSVGTAMRKHADRREKSYDFPTASRHFSNN
jgi:hypothetical protein